MLGSAFNYFCLNQRNLILSNGALRDTPLKSAKNSPMFLASPLIIRKTLKTERIIDEWESLCFRDKLIKKLKNMDQDVLNYLIYKYRVPGIDVTSIVYNALSPHREFKSFNHILRFIYEQKNFQVITHPSFKPSAIEIAIHYERFQKQFKSHRRSLIS